MKLEEQVCSLELAKKLKELGVKQESIFWWYFDKKQNGNWGEPNNPAYLYLWDITYSAGLMDIEAEVKVSAFTVAELGEMLPAALERTATWLTIERQWNGGWMVSYTPDDGEPSATKYGPTIADTEADARAKMLIYLIENKLITV